MPSISRFSRPRGGREARGRITTVAICDISVKPYLSPLIPRGLRRTRAKALHWIRWRALLRGGLLVGTKWVVHPPAPAPASAPAPQPSPAQPSHGGIQINCSPCAHASATGGARNFRLHVLDVFAWITIVIGERLTARQYTRLFVPRWQLGLGGNPNLPRRPCDDCLIVNGSKFAYPHSQAA